MAYFKFRNTVRISLSDFNTSTQTRTAKYGMYVSIDSINCKYLVLHLSDIMMPSHTLAKEMRNNIIFNAI
jgi:hypothetical protein